MTDAAPQQAYESVWTPNAGPQTALITCPVFEVFFGGARGGGKTSGMLGEWLNHAQAYGRDAAALMVRRERTQLIDTIEESKKLYGLLGATYNETDKLWRMANGARFQFAYLESDSDAEAYQGRQNTRVYVEEMPNFPRPDPIMKLKATLRSVKGVPTGFRATGNPGGSGHTWVKQRYIDPAPGGYKIITDESGLERVFIPSRVQDNAALALADPGYVARLRASGSEELVRAWLEGDWNVVQGAFFGEWSSAKHVVEPHELPKAWVRYRCMDWGSAAPFAVYWVAVSDGSLPQYPRGALVFYREWYGVAVAKDGTWKANVGLKLTAEEVAQGILERTPAEEKIDMGVLDPAAFANHGGPSIAERMMAVTLGRRRVQFHRADNTRVGVRGAMSGWDGIRGRLKGDDDGRPMMYFFSTCVHAIRTLPALQHDMMRPEDVDTDGEDHAGDAIRYGCAARPWVRASVKAEPPPRLRGSTSMTINEIIAKRRRERLEESS